MGTAEQQLRVNENATNQHQDKIEDQHHALQKLATERDEVDRNYEEIMRKVQRMDLEYDRLQERAAKLESDNNTLKEENREYVSNIRSIEATNNSYISREEKLETRLAQLQTKFDESERIAESSSAEAKKLAKIVSQLEDELEKTRADKNRIQQELDSTM